MSINEELDIKRKKFWMDFDALDNENKPIVKHSHITFCVILPREAAIKLPGSVYNPYTIYLDVDDLGGVSLGSRTYWYGKRVEDMEWEEQMEVFDFLAEWELIKSVQVGPEDSEWFATDKLVEGHEYA
jgi:hypothetical protein